MPIGLTQRRTLLIAMALVSVVAIIGSVGTFQPPPMMQMGGMMSGSEGMGFFLWPGVLFTSVVLLILALGYVVLFPSIRYSSTTQQTSVSVSSVSQDPMNIVMRVAKPDEQAALEVLIDSGGLCLQKDITYKAKISKLKTHRIVARLAERGIIEVRKSGKTNEISVPAWLKVHDSTANHEGSAK